MNEVNEVVYDDTSPDSEMYIAPRRTGICCDSSSQEQYETAIANQQLLQADYVGLTVEQWRAKSSEEQDARIQAKRWNHICRI